MTDTKSVERPDGAHEELIIASRVEKTPVINSYGDKIGHIEDLSIERESGRVRYALMSFGGFLGMGDKLHPLPWSVLKYDQDRRGYVVPLTKEELSDAPSYSAEELTDYGGRDIEFRDDLYAYYRRFGAAPHW
jgi:sporulation protein YlmC with PRC-barrel domain